MHPPIPYRRHLMALAGLVMLLSLCGCDDYGKVMRKRLQEVLGKSPLWGGTRYTWFEYPTNNFGIGTTFILTAGEPQANENTQRCATYTCLGIDRPKTADDVKSAGGFADFGEGGVITLNKKEINAVSVSAVLPKIYEILKVDIGTSVKSTTTTELSLGPACIRVLDKEKYEKVLSNLPNDDPRKQAFAAGGLAYVVADVMVQSMSITISVDKEVDPKLGASLEGAVGKVLGEQAKLEVGVTKNVNGTYTLKCNDPVIVAALVKKQSMSHILSSAPMKGIAQWDKDSDTMLKSSWVFRSH